MGRIINKLYGFVLLVVFLITVIPALVFAWALLELEKRSYRDDILGW